MGLLDRLKAGLKRTKDLLFTDVRDLFKSGEPLTEERLEQFFARLIATDMGVAAANAIREELRKEHLGRLVDVDAIWATVKAQLKLLLKGGEGTSWNQTEPLSALNLGESKPAVILVAGVNGVGKTTSIAKLANLLKKNGKSVVLAAGDTFRAAAVEQLTLWSKRLDCEIVTKPAGSDPASVAHAGCSRALEIGADVVIVDTAGRLQTQANLMKELEKIHRVISARVPGAPQEVLLVLDAETRWNGQGRSGRGDPSKHESSREVRGRGRTDRRPRSLRCRAVRGSTLRLTS